MTGRGEGIAVRGVQGFLMACGLVAGCAGSLPEPPVEPRPEAILPARPADEAADGFARRGLEVRLQGLPLPPIPREHPKVGRLTGQGSLAIGTTRDGFVVGCRPFPLEGPHHRVLKVQAQRGTNCGTDELVEALLRVAEAVAKRFPGAILPVGNLSRFGGGDIPWSISHNAGRDVDIGFYLVGPDGRQVLPDDFVRLDRSGRGEARVGDEVVPVRLDVARQWHLVRTLLTDPEIEVQWLFVSRPIREALLEHAKRRGEPEALVARASEALAQPRRALPHDDHLHLRIYCSEDDLLEGCQDRGTDRSWHVVRSGLLEARVRELKRLLSARSPRTRAAAITVLGRMGRREFLPLFARSLFDRDPGVRFAGASALREVGVAGAETVVLRALASGTDETLVPVLLQALNRTLRGQRRVEVLARLLGVRRQYRLDFGVFEVRQSVAEWALEEIEASPASHAVPVLIKVLRRADVDREAISRSLTRLTAFDPGEAQDPVRAWEVWWRTHRRLSPSKWYVEAFRQVGVLRGDTANALDIEALARVVATDENRRRGAWVLLREATAPLGDQWRRPWPADSIEPWGVLAKGIAGSLLAESARSNNAHGP